MGQTLFENAEWIIADVQENEMCDIYFEYIDSFFANATGTTKLYISAHSQYAVYINDIFVNCGQYDDYEDYQVYDTLDVTQHLQVGKNELYIGHYVCGSDFSTRQKQMPGLIFSIQNEGGCLLASDCNCLSRKNEHFLKNGEKIIISRQYVNTLKEALGL